MDAHPIPQDVASFEFHLVGDMTLKQFSYLGAGIAIAYIAFVFFATPYPILAWPIILLSAGTGAAFAFVPLFDRSLDHWVISYLRAIFNPTKRSWQLNSASTDSEIFLNRLNIYLHQVYGEPIPIFQAQPEIKPPPQAGPVHIPQTPIQSEPIPPLPKQEEKRDDVALSKQPSSDELKQLVETAKQAQIAHFQIAEHEKQLERLREQAKKTTVDPIAFNQKFQSIMHTLQSLSQQTQLLEQELGRMSGTPVPVAKKPKVIAFTPSKITPSQVTLTSTPNIINGIITDSQGAYLEGVIVVTHDKDNLPVRALKTNKLGQFIAATPLPNGTYTITLEKEDLEFDSIQIELNGALLPPIRISANKAMTAQAT